MSKKYPIVVIGGGPAGLAAGYELLKHQITPLVLERDTQVGGIARTVNYKGYRFDIGGHRFFTKNEEIQALWDEILGDQFLTRPRLSRIYYRNRFFNYPLKPLNALMGVGVLDTARILASYIKARLFPIKEERTFEQWVTNRFGRRLFEIFFKTYTEKVWGISTSELGADWAAQRIKGLSLLTAVLNAFKNPKSKNGEIVKTLIDQFQYPRFGPGQMYEAFQQRINEQGGEVRLQTEAIRVCHRDGQVTGVVVRNADGTEETIPTDYVINTMPITDLVVRMDPPAPANARAAAEQLGYRNLIAVNLILNRPYLWEDNWIYIHSPEVRVGRIQNYKRWSEDMVPNPDHSVVGLEYFCFDQDDLWQMTDNELIALGMQELEHLGLGKTVEVIDACVARAGKAYPIYYLSYQERLALVRGYLGAFANLQTCGRYGMYRYNNMDHSIYTALLAVRNYLGGDFDVWSVNSDAQYHEEQRVIKNSDQNASS